MEAIESTALQEQHECSSASQSETDLQPGDAERYQVWVKAVEHSKFCSLTETAVALKFAGPKGEYPDEPPTVVEGSNLKATVLAIKTIVLRLPPGSSLHVTSDEENFWKAFHRDYNRFAKWLADDFKSLSAGTRAEWRELAEAKHKGNIEITADRPTSNRDNDILQDLRKAAQALSKPKLSVLTGDPPQDYIPPDDPDWLLQRALGREV